MVKFQGARFIAFLLAALVVTYLAISAYAFVYLREPSVTNAEVLDLQSKLVAALRDRNIAVSERDAVRREHGGNSASEPQIPQSLKADEIEARIDAWKGVDAQMN